MARTNNRKQVDFYMNRLCFLTGTTQSYTEMKEKNLPYYLIADYAPIYGGWRLDRAMNESGTRPGTFGNSGTEVRMNAASFVQYLRGLCDALMYTVDSNRIDNPSK